MSVFIEAISIQTSLAVKVTRTVAGTITVLALAGAVATAALIFAVGLTVLWPALIACACLAAVGVVALIAHSIFQWKLARNIKDCIVLLSAMGKSISILEAIHVLAKKKNISPSEGDKHELKDCISGIVNKKMLVIDREIETLNALFEAKENKLQGFHQHHLSLENFNSFPIFVAILSLISNSKFSIKKEDDGDYQIFNYPTGRNANVSCGNCICSTYNYGDADSITNDGQLYVQNAIEKIGKNRVFVSHYDGNGKLVIDP